MRRKQIKGTVMTVGDWAITEFGLEFTGNDEYTGFYEIPRARLGEDWLEHMTEKIWVNEPEIWEALLVARKYHGVKKYYSRTKRMMIDLHEKQNPKEAA